MAEIKTDTFTVGSDTALESHTSDSGGGWSGGDTTRYDIQASNDEVDIDSSSRRVALGDETPGSADQIVKVNGKTGTTNTNNRVGPIARASGNASSGTYYCAVLTGDGDVGLEKSVSGSITTLGTPQSVSGFNASTYYDIEVTCDGDQISLDFDNGTLTETVTDTSITQVGKIGMVMLRVDPRITSIDADTIEAGGGGVSIPVIQHHRRMQGVI